MLIKVLTNLFALGCFLASDLSMPLGELLILVLILARDLFVLLADDLRLGTTILVFKRLLIE